MASGHAGATGRVPAGLRPPVRLALAQLVEQIPEPSALPGGCVYEAKWDGFRLAVVRDGEATSVWSRQGTDLTGRFPDVVAAAAAHVPSGTVLDGEVVMWSLAGERLDFAGLQRRMAAGPRAIERLAREQPAYYVAFDVLGLDGTDLRARPFGERRAVLEQLAAGWGPPLHLSPLLHNRGEAGQWFEHMDAAGLEGLVVKGLAQPYRATRSWLKVKRRRELDVVCAAVLGSIARPDAVVAGLPLDGELKIVGRSVPLPAMTAKALAVHLIPARPPHPWPERIASGVVGGFGREREPVDLTLVQPLVVEVSADAAWSGRTFRHPLRALRARPDLDPAEVRVPERLT